jgi:branched-chain amino acid transport system permease protein
VTTILEVLVNGLGFGAVYALVGLGLALVYKATRILNFAQGELGTVPAFAGYLVLTGFQVDGNPQLDRGRLWIATVVAVVLGAALGVLTNAVVIRKLASVSPVTSLVATAGVMTFLISVQVIVFEAKGRRFARYIEGGFDMPGTDIVVAWHTVLVVVVLAGAAALLALLFRTPPGVALLATAQEPFAAELQGISVAAMRTLAWAAAGALGGLAGLLGAGVFSTSFSPGLMTATFLIPAFTGAVLGGISSMIGAVAGGLLLGVTVQAANQINQSFELGIPGPPHVAALAVLLIVLLARPQGLFGDKA